MSDRIVFGRHQQIGVSALVGAAHSPAKLIQLGKAESVRAIDQNRVGARNVQAVFDDGGGHQDVGFVANKLQHDGFQFFFAHLAVSDDHAGLGHQLGDQAAQRIDGLHAIVDEIDLAIARQLVSMARGRVLPGKARRRFEWRGGRAAEFR